MPSELEQKLVAVARQYTDGQSVDIEIPLLRINSKIHPCGVVFQLDCSPHREPLTDAEKRKLVQVEDSRNGVALMIRLIIDNPPLDPRGLKKGGLTFLDGADGTLPAPWQ